MGKGQELLNMSPEEVEQKYSTSEPHHTKHGYYWWIMALRNGKTVLLGAYNTEEEAEKMGYSKVEGHFEVIALPTRDTAKATQIVRAKKLYGGDSLEESMSRMKHQI